MQRFYIQYIHFVGCVFFLWTFVEDAVCFYVLFALFTQNSTAALPWGLVTSLPRTLQTLVAELGVDRKSLSIIDTVTRGMYVS